MRSHLTRNVRFVSWQFTQLTNRLAWGCQSGYAHVHHKPKRYPVHRVYQSGAFVNQNHQRRGCWTLRPHPEAEARSLQLLLGVPVSRRGNGPFLNFRLGVQGGLSVATSRRSYYPPLCSSHATKYTRKCLCYRGSMICHVVDSNDRYIAHVTAEAHPRAKSSLHGHKQQRYER